MEFTVQCSYVEIYMERVRDLLDPMRTNLKIKEDPQTGVYIQDATEVFVVSQEEMLELMRQGDASRAVAATGMNEGSSRSHSLFLITLNQKNNDTGLIKKGRLFLVDLAGAAEGIGFGRRRTRRRSTVWCIPAGSETVNKTGVRGQQLEEAKKINKVSR